MLPNTHSTQGKPTTKRHPTQTVRGAEKPECHCSELRRGLLSAENKAEEGRLGCCRDHQESPLPPLLLPVMRLDS